MGQQTSVEASRNNVDPFRLQIFLIELLKELHTASDIVTRKKCLENNKVTAEQNIIEYPFALEWTIPDRSLKALQHSTKNKYIESEKFAAIQSSDAQYFVRIYPNGNNDSNRGKTVIILYLGLGNEKEEIEAKFKFSIKSANYCYEEIRFIENEKENSKIQIGCTVDEFFDSTKKFMVAGNLILKVEGNLKIEKKNSEMEILNNFKPNVLIYL
uniref:MATH domain-containing protein n=1 Tax=Panagrolaimus sp. ES5 TaxID=591445 RepID=A0AC34GRR5_9BILA